MFALLVIIVMPRCSSSPSSCSSSQCYVYASASVSSSSDYSSLSGGEVPKPTKPSIGQRFDDDNWEEPSPSGIDWVDWQAGELVEQSQGKLDKQKALDMSRKLQDKAIADVAIELEKTGKRPQCQSAKKGMDTRRFQDAVYSALSQSK